MKKNLTGKGNYSFGMAYLAGQASAGYQLTSGKK
jgi:hypothetical protein